MNPVGLGMGSRISGVCSIHLIEVEIPWFCLDRPLPIAILILERDQTFRRNEMNRNLLRQGCPERELTLTLANEMRTKIHRKREGRELVFMFSCFISLRISSPQVSRVIGVGL